MMQFPFEGINRRIRTKTSHGISSPKEWSQQIWFRYTNLNLNEKIQMYMNLMRDPGVESIIMESDILQVLYNVNIY